MTLMRFLLFLIFCSKTTALIDEEQAFEEYMRKFGKTYSSPEEKKYRFSIFSKNFQMISAEDASELGRLKNMVLLGASKQEAKPRSYTKEINDFGDLSDEEFASFYLLPKETLYKKTRPRLLPAMSPSPRQHFFPTTARMLQNKFNLPSNVNWKNLVNAPKNQLKCNSCYAFAAASVLEAMYKKKTNESIQLSEQEILDCSKENEGCKGGQPAAAFDYVIDNSLAFEKDYPYKGQTGSKCLAKTNNNRLLQAAKAQKAEAKNRKKTNYARPKRRDLQGVDLSRYSYLPYYNQLLVLSPEAQQSFASQYGRLHPSNNPSSSARPNTPRPNSNNPQKPNVSPSSPPTKPPQSHPTTPKNPSTSPPVKRPQPKVPKPPSSQPPVHNPPQQPPKPPTPPPPVQTPPPQPPKPQSPPPSSSSRFSSLKNYRSIPENIVAVLQELSKGPIVVAMFVSSAFKFYKSGVFNGDGCSDHPTANHSVMAVGYDLQAEIPYILIQNSWGGVWGEDGYYKIAIGDLSENGKGLCLIANTPFNVAAEF